MVNIAIVEDEEKASNNLIEFLNKYQKEHDEMFNITAKRNGLQFLEQYEPIYDVIFMDIQMPYIDGMETSKKVREIDSNTQIIFVTNMAKYAINGYEVDALAFLVKPISYYNFERIMDKLMKKITLSSKDTLMVNSDNGIQKIVIDDILYIEVSNHDLYYHTFNGTYKTRGSLTKVEEEMAKYSFEKCNNCYLVNLKHVNGIQATTVIVGKEKLQLSRSKKKSFTEAVVNYIGDKA